MRPSEFYSVLESMIGKSGLLSPVPMRLNQYDDELVNKAVQTHLKDTGICIVGFFLDTQGETPKNGLFSGSSSFVLSVIANPSVHARFIEKEAPTDARAFSPLELTESLLVFLSACSDIRACQLDGLLFPQKPIQRVQAEEGQVRFNLEFQVPTNYSVTSFDFDLQLGA